MLNYQINPKFKPFILIADMLGYALIHPILSLKRFNKAKIKRILVIRIDEIGDVILATPVFRALKEEFPGCKVDVLVKKGTKEVLEHNPNVDNTIICEKDWLRNKLDIAYFLSLAKKLKGKYDLMIELHTSPVNILLAFFIGGYKIGYAFRGLGFLSNKTRFLAKKEHIIDRNLDLLKLININHKSRKMDVFFSKKEEVYVNALLKKHKLTGKKLICINPGTLRANKLWQNNKWAELSDTLMEKYNAYILFTGSSNEKPLVNDIISMVKNKNKAVNLAGETGLLQLAALIKRCRLFIGTDSGPLHIARAVETPLIGLYGPTNPFIWGYNEDKYKSVYKKLDCSFCNQEGCKRRKEKELCLRSIKVEDVVKEVKRLF
ncbi:lipopolysaccharide heptosyltransferase II [Candidatus Woesearchaeota archaeon]|nr:lipopolysaccharide heptosyltransferase II [Candidatus Woesearchaeota archaeon]|tara:strand:- start:1460 stop:2587 length:1128 start_codon:yes stop_codon:yes gene_type:complete